MHTWTAPKKQWVVLFPSNKELFHFKPLTVDLSTPLVTTRCNRTKNKAEEQCGPDTAPFKPDFDAALTLTSAGIHQVRIYLCLILAPAAQTPLIPS